MYNQKTQTENSETKSEKSANQNMQQQNQKHDRKIENTAKSGNQQQNQISEPKTQEEILKHDSKKESGDPYQTSCVCC